MLCVHTDTVFPHIPESFSMKKGRLSCKNKGIGLGADDRNGCFLLHQVMLNRPKDFIFAVFELEELGCIGSRSFNMFQVQDMVSVLIGLDRKGSNELALYGFESEELLKLLDTFPNYHTDFGSITDCAVLAEESNICCFNLSVGYYKQHTEREFTIVRDVERAEKFLLNLPEEFWNKHFITDFVFFDDTMSELDRYYDPYLKKINAEYTKRR
jgi:putative aminopeptidase FrvX